MQFLLVALLLVAAERARALGAEHKWVTRHSVLPLPTTASVVSLHPDFDRCVFLRQRSFWSFNS